MHFWLNSLTVFVWKIHEYSDENQTHSLHNSSYICAVLNYHIARHVCNSFYFNIWRWYFAIKWDIHIDEISRKIAKSVGVLYRARHYLNLNALKSLYYCLIYPYISYSALTWGSNYLSKLKPIHILQKRAARAISFAGPRTPSKPLFQKLGFLNIYEVVRFQLGELVYKQVNHLIPDIFSNYFHQINHKYDTRSKTKGNLSLPKPKLNYGKFNVKYASAKVWNDLPLEIRNSVSLASFKRKYKKYLLSFDWDDYSYSYLLIFF